jgi:hypothetical protein
MRARLRMVSRFRGLPAPALHCFSLCDMGLLSVNGCLSLSQSVRNAPHFDQIQDANLRERERDLSRSSRPPAGTTNREARVHAMSSSHATGFQRQDTGTMLAQVFAIVSRKSTSAPLPYRVALLLRLPPVVHTLSPVEEKRLRICFGPSPLLNCEYSSLSHHSLSPPLAPIHPTRLNITRAACARAPGIRRSA